MTGYEVPFADRVAFTAERIMTSDIRNRSTALTYLTQLNIRIAPVMDTPREGRKRPQCGPESSPHRDPTNEHMHTLSTGRGGAVNFANQADPMISTEDLNAFSKFKFFDDDEPGPNTKGHDYSGTLHPLDAEAPKYHRLADEKRSGILQTHYDTTLRDTFLSDTPPPPSFPAYADSSKLNPEELAHPSGSPILIRDSVREDEEYRSRKSGPELKHDDVRTAKEQGGDSAKRRKSDGHQTDKKKVDVQDLGSVALDEPTVSVAKHVAAPGHIEEYHVKPKIVTMVKGKDVPQDKPRRHSTNAHPNEQQETPSIAPAGQIRRKSLPVDIRPHDPPAASLEATREWLNNLADEESEKWSNESTAATSEPSEDNKQEAGQTVPYSQSEFAKSKVSLDVPGSLPNIAKASQNDKATAKTLPTAKQPRDARPATPGPTGRSASPPLHGNAAENRKPLEKEGRDSYTLYSTSCSTEKSYLKTLLKGPTLEFRIEPHGEPFLVDVSQNMLIHFCGEEHTNRVIQTYSLRPEERRDEDGEKTILVFPEDTVDANAIMRIIRYMRRCCMRTTTLTKPHFQLHAPPSLEANIETIRACNMFGLYADARRLQYFLTDKKIPGGKLTMEDVETIWEGYDGELRDSAYTDALLTHLVYNVLGSDSIDREDIMVLLQQEEFAGLRELLGTELGINKRAAESRDMFQMRKELEREEKIDRLRGRSKRLSKLEKLRASRGPMVQGRLLRVLSYDALLEPDLTAETRYKQKAGMGRSTSTPELVEGRSKEEVESAGRAYQDALRDVEGYSDGEEESVMWMRNPPDRPSAPTPSGRTRHTDNPGEMRVEPSRQTRATMPRRYHQPNQTSTRGTRYPSADARSSTTSFKSQRRPGAPPLQPRTANIPPHPQQTRTQTIPNTPRPFTSTLGRRQPGSSITNINQTRYTSASRSGTGPRQTTLRPFPSIPRTKSRSKVKQIWDNLKHLL